MASKNQERPRVTLIKSKGSLIDLRLKELLKSKDLIKMLVRRDFLTVYKQTILGPLWFIVQPIITTIMYVFVFGRIAQLGTDGIAQPIFYFSGTMIWTFFSTCLQKTSDTFITNASLFGKIYFPRLAVPISYVTTGLITFGIQFCILVILIIYYVLNGMSFALSTYSLLIPVIIIQTAALAVGVGLIISAFTTKYRDLRTLVNFGLALWMYITPVVYPLSQVPGRMQGYYVANPMSSVLEMYRFFMLNKGNPSFLNWYISLAISVILLILGIIVFNHSERTFVDVI